MSKGFAATITPHTMTPVQPTTHLYRAVLREMRLAVSMHASRAMGNAAKGRQECQQQLGRCRLCLSSLSSNLAAYRGSEHR